MDDFNNTFGENDEGGTPFGANLVTAKGTGNGLLLRINSEASCSELIPAIKEYVSSRQSFLGGNKVSVEWQGGIPVDETVNEVSSFLKAEFNISVSENTTKKGEGLKVSNTKGFTPPRSEKDSEGGLFAGMDNLSDAIEEEISFDDTEVTAKPAKSSSSHNNSMFWDNPDAMIMQSTLRSGQKIETEHSLILVGDVNCGAEIVAGGDVIVLGTLRGVVHAGAYDETGAGRFIFSLDLQPTQLRIGSVITRGAEGSNKIPEIAYVDGNMIMVEPYSSRRAIGKMR